MENLRLKFRVWDKIHKKYIYCDFVGFCSVDKSGKGLKKIIFRPSGIDQLLNDGKIFYANEEDVILEQCTGLKDRNGKLIYEGDIIVIPNEYPFYDCKHTDGEPVLNYIGIVKWIYNCWQYEYQCVNPKKSGISNGINNLLNEFGFDDDELSDFEVVGNIHENPELLEQKDDR